MGDKPTSKQPLTNLFGGSNCGIGKGGFQQGNDCAKGRSGGANPTGANPAGGSIPGHVAKEIDGFFGGVIGGRKGKAQLEDFKGVARGIFSRLTLGTGPLVAKGIAAGIRHSPKAFNLLIKGLQALGPRKTLVDKAQPMGANPASGSRGSTANPMGQAGAGSEGRKKIAEYRTIRNQAKSPPSNKPSPVDDRAKARAEMYFAQLKELLKNDPDELEKLLIACKEAMKTVDKGQQQKGGIMANRQWQTLTVVNERMCWGRPCPNQPGSKAEDAPSQQRPIKGKGSPPSESKPGFLKRAVSKVGSAIASAFDIGSFAGQQILMHIAGRFLDKDAARMFNVGVMTVGDEKRKADVKKEVDDEYNEAMRRIEKKHTRNSSPASQILALLREAGATNVTLADVEEALEQQVQKHKKTTNNRQTSPSREWETLPRTDNLLGAVGSTIRKGFGKVAKFLGGTAEGSRKKPYVNPQPDDDDDKPAVPAPPKRVLAPRMKGEKFTPAASAARRAARGTSTYEKTKARETATRSQQHLTGPIQLPKSALVKEDDDKPDHPFKVKKKGKNSGYIARLS